MTIQVDSNGVAITITPEELGREWVHVLKSEGLTQATGALHKLADEDAGIDRTKDGFCCLGVVCDLAHKYGIVERVVSYDEVAYGEERNTTTLPREVIDFLGLSQSNPHVEVLSQEADPDFADDYDEDEVDTYDLATLNDEHGFDFEKLGELIEAQVVKKS